MLSTLGTFLTGSGLTVIAILLLLLCHPEKVEKWVALVWRVVHWVVGSFHFAQKKYFQHDFQGSVNDFVRKHAKEMPGFHFRGVKLEWITGDVRRKAFIEAGQVVVRVRRDDASHENFVHAVYLFVSTSLLFRAKRFISPPQGRAIDLFVSTAIFRDQKPEVVDYFLEEYLHPGIDDGTRRVNELFDGFDCISRAGLFFPVFLQEMDCLGQRVFGNRKSQLIVSEVDELIDFLKSLAERRVGDSQVELEFVKQYCRFAVVIVGKRKKLIASLEPYANFIRRKLAGTAETVYLIGLDENAHLIRQVCGMVADCYEVVSEKHVPKTLHFTDGKRRLMGYVAVLRSKNRELYMTSFA